MRVICTRTKLLRSDIEKISGIHGCPVGYNEEYTDDLKVGMYYVVMGICLYIKPNCLYYLVSNCENDPSWKPSLMFEIVDNTFPLDWYLKVFNKDERETVHAIWGFNELCNNNFDQRLDLMEHAALHTYAQRKQEITLELYPEMLEGYHPDNKLILIDQADNYVMCEHCTYAWGVVSDKKNIACPECSQIYKNPFLPSHSGMDITKSL